MGTRRDASGGRTRQADHTGDTRRAGPPVVVVTGASSGIGRETARRFARRGSRLVLASRSRPALETVARECRAAGAEVLVVPTDVSDERSVDALAAAAVAEFGGIDVWVGNAGVFAYGAFEDLPSEVFRQVVETDLMGQVHGARAALRHFRPQGHGTLVLIGSLYAQVGSPAISPYATSKFGLRGFAECLRAELRGSGIRVRLVLPSTIDTPIYRNAANFTGRRVRPLPPVTSPQRVARAILRAPRSHRFAIPVGRIQTAVRPVHDLAPPVYDAVAAWLMDHVELHGRGPAADPGTVITAPRAAGAVTGGWRSPGLRLAIGAIAAAAGGLLLSRRMREANRRT
ncbi:SDR family NAD(P)-dependent oxidoreductase [Microbacterium sp. NPDC058342]|uniref:SDR family NAD(P)-dependent oxidoreductase n=1 Tax=Microbacterium sp. NPDC058342 TaxID=3346454 RepID=UPI0036555753